jgi:hypothetical protein
VNGASRESIAEGLAGLTRSFEGVRDPRTSVLDGLPESVRSSGALLATVLGQDMKVGSLARLLRELHHRLGDRLLAQGTGDWVSLERACRIPWLAEWPHKDSLAGWVLSVSDYLRAHGPVEAWTMPEGGPRELVYSMARELPWMGGRSPYKVKGWRLLRWLARGEWGAPSWDDRCRARLVVPVAAVERPLRTLGWLPGGWQEFGPDARQEWFDGVLDLAMPDDPTRVWVPLETVLARGRNGPACQEHLKGCAGCPVRASCPTPGRV